MLYSFDIFDTCLVRKCGTSSNLFYHLAMQYYGENRSYDLYKDFVHDRKESEKIALKLTRKKSVTIREIYSCMKENFGYEDAEQLMALEMDLENKMLSPVHSIKEEIQKCRGEAGFVVFISDMYLPYEFLEKILVSSELKEEQDKLFVSCEYNATKADGSLFQIVSQEVNNNTYKRWKHVGDNSYSDYEVPRKLGIKSIVMSHKYSFYERFYIEDQFYSSCKEETLFLGSLLKSYRLKESTNYARDFAIDVISSVYLPYIYWVLKKSQEQGINHLLFLARDSEIFYKAALVFKRIFPDIKLSYIYVSRKSLFLPSISMVSKEELDTALAMELNSTPRYILKKFQLQAENIKGLEDFNLDKPILSRSVLSSFIEKLVNLGNDKLLGNKIAEARKSFLKYLGQLGVMKDEQIGLIDLGWSGSSRYAINKIFKEEGYKPSVAYYWGYFGSASPQYNYRNGGALNVFNYLADNKDAKLPGFVIPMVMEHYFSMTKDGTTLSYKDEGSKVIPVMGERDNDMSNIVDLHISILQDLSKEIMNYPNLLMNLENIFYTHGRKIWASFLSYPQKEDIQLLKGIMVSDVGLVPLICRLNFIQRLQIVLTDNVFGAAPVWKLASLYDSPFRGLYHLIYTKLSGTAFSRKLNRLLLFFKSLIS